MIQSFFSFLLDEGVGDGLHAVERADDYNGRSSADHKSQSPKITNYKRNTV